MVAGGLDVDFLLADAFALALAVTVGLGLGDALVALLLLGLLAGAGLLVEAAQLNLAHDLQLRTANGLGNRLEHIIFLLLDNGLRSLIHGLLHLGLGFRLLVDGLGFGLSFLFRLNGCRFRLGYGSLSGLGFVVGLLLHFGGSGLLHLGFGCSLRLGGRFGLAGAVEINLTQECRLLAGNLGLDLAALGLGAVFGLLLLSLVGHLLALVLQVHVGLEFLDEHFIDVVLDARVDVIVDFDTLLEQEIGDSLPTYV